ncbi:hypothetical protein MLD38_004307 [Melastoma candidum]|uniref:Uncharacterized protein n=1 Tax=Melastoma candidum TaxID=119954 RepID=A0ACB9S4I1_9MYRT|nr:hypothetical protein MLD38_004307 [Melastoma candidum]
MFSGHATFVRPHCHFYKHLLSISAIPTYDYLQSLLGSCRSACEVSQVHGFIVKSGLEGDSFVLSKLLASAINDARYASCIFGRVERTNLFMFNTIIRAYSISDDPSRSLSIFNDLRLQSFALDEFSFIGVLKSCSRVRSESFGEGIHGIVIRNGCRVYVGIKNAILSFYGGCGRELDARKLFDEIPEWNDLVSWNTLIGCYANLGRPNVVIDLFRRLVSSGPRITVSTMLSALSAGSNIGIRGVEMLHGLCIKTGFCSKIEVQTSLIDAYARVGNVRAGRRIFDGTELKDAAIWNCMVHCYARKGLLDESLALFELMKSLNLDPIPVSLAGLFCCCADSGALSIGELLHEYAVSKGLLADPVVGTALIDMYAKCGSLDKAREAFDRISEKDVKSWTAMISAYGNHGQAGNSLEIFNRMVEDGCSPNDVTLLAVLNACSHGGLVMESIECFSRMVSEYGISPGIGHYGCLIDLLGRSGMLEEAYELIGSLPVKADASIWRALLAACRLYSNVVLAKNVTKILAEQFGQHPADSILLLSTGTALGCFPDTQPETESEEKHHKKEAGCSSILA